MNMRNINRIICIISLATIVVLGFFVWVLPCQAYTGSIAIFPALSGGPDHKTVSNIDINTEEHNPYYQDVSLNYVKAIFIETNPTINSHLLISEYPSGDSVAFSFTVPKPFQDALVSATVYFWGPDVSSLQIWHQHQGEPDTQLTAIKVEPEQRNADGNVLWYFTTTSFSTFFTSESPIKINTSLPIYTIVGLVVATLSALFVLKKN